MRHFGLDCTIIGIGLCDWRHVALDSPMCCKRRYLWLGLRTSLGSYLWDYCCLILGSDWRCMRNCSRKNHLFYCFMLLDPFVAYFIFLLLVFDPFLLIFNPLLLVFLLIFDTFLLLFLLVSDKFLLIFGIFSLAFLRFFSLIILFTIGCMLASVVLIDANVINSARERLHFFISLVSRSSNSICLRMCNVDWKMGDVIFYIIPCSFFFCSSRCICANFCFLLFLSLTYLLKSLLNDYLTNCVFFQEKQLPCCCHCIVAVIIPCLSWLIGGGLCVIVGQYPSILRVVFGCFS